MGHTPGAPWPSSGPAELKAIAKLFCKTHPGSFWSLVLQGHSPLPFLQKSQE